MIRAFDSWSTVFATRSPASWQTPDFDPLRGDPQFQKLVSESEPN
jgi:hypothetical protein